MGQNYTWIPIYKELSEKLLAYKNRRRELVDWIYDTFGKRNDGKSSLIGYLHEMDGSRIKDIDPLSVIAMFNRGISDNNKIGFLKQFKELLNLRSELPTDFNGVPVMNAMHSFFFDWNDPQGIQIELLWSLFSKAIAGESFEEEYNKTIRRPGIKYSLTMALFWIQPERFLALDSNNRAYLEKHGISIADTPDYTSYTSILEEVKTKMENGEISSHSFYELSADAWKFGQKTFSAASSDMDSKKVWLLLGDEKTFEREIVLLGNLVSNTISDFSIFRKKTELRAACQEALQNTDVSIANAYWQFITEVSVGDYIVVFKNKRINGKNAHLMYGWGTITSDVIHVPGDDYPLRRSVQWSNVLPARPIEDTMLHNSLFFHVANEKQAQHIKELLGISTAPASERGYWLAGYAFRSTESQLERFLNNGIWEGSGDEKTNDLIQSIKKGDILILKSTSTKGKDHDLPFLRVKGLGIVTSDLTILNGADYHFDVDYIPVEETDFDGNSYGKYRKTLHECDDVSIKEWADNIIDKKRSLANMKEVRHKEYIDLLLASRNLILTGAPGTGKTFLAKMIAEEMGAEIEFVQFHPSYDYTDFVEGLRPTATGSFERRDGIFKEFCKKAIKNLEDSKKSQETLAVERSLDDKIDSFLSQAVENETELVLKSGNRFVIYDYDEKVIRAESKDNEKTTHIDIKMSEVHELLEKNVQLNNVRDIREYYGRKFGTQQDSYTFVIVSGIRSTKSTATTIVSKVAKKDYVFIIDEINRGEISKILGELFFSIDPGYRGEKGRVKTQYQNLVEEGDVFSKGFFIPENVYIIGTMNDIDRSVESMDFAVRRRFTWKEVLPEERLDMWDDCIGNWKIEAAQRMNRINNLISAGTVGLTREYSIGPAYFRNLDKYAGDFARLWNLHLEPLVKEYLRGNRNLTENLDALRKAYELVDESE